MRNIVSGLLAAALLVGCGGSELDAQEPLPQEDTVSAMASPECDSCIPARSECYSTAETYPQKVICSSNYTLCRQTYCN
ncbi:MULTISPECIES: hypothetical protein [Myxococcus]|uniref:Lipoprotein n=1 Tax=Myxococcus llanfairpwllgwyngyllgogerychwyrndrobwllllantysiliogogogochensis TaxID=2590453 RepID=A0A540WQ75_9BACT|nr:MULTISPECIES: hypothetical protein [Myxococcus]NTX07775.1 hypothetical protein [Myxococcus sp. CA040A]NTX16007.1 hypothetical protein [Myxococcus sp. CA056]NTX41002.1 hypothetical protein [Myxococcus sp. CA033]NTX56221.1 hypothetical protein [Myxococcus sp. CA039A]TQF11171.1 hypothetical protein FJV41_35600 [Myxococcus llanfairpwllgwyngyllgogerychwyrndrobwllllantysiliogogogochensis]